MTGFSRLLSNDHIGKRGLRTAIGDTLRDVGGDGGKDQGTQARKRPAILARMDGQRLGR